MITPQELLQQCLNSKHGKPIKIEEQKNSITYYYADKSTIILEDGVVHYGQFNKEHRLDGPALLRPDGLRMYYVNNKLHREDGPAIIYPDGFCQYYLHGVHVNEHYKPYGVDALYVGVNDDGRFFFSAVAN